MSNSERGREPSFRVDPLDSVVAVNRSAKVGWPDFHYVNAAAGWLGLEDWRSAADELRHIAFEAHGAHLERLAAEGVVLLVARAMDASGDGFGLAIVEAPDDDAARALAAADPFVARGVARAHVYPFHLSFLSPALAGDAGG